MGSPIIHTLISLNPPLLTKVTMICVWSKYETATHQFPSTDVINDVTQYMDGYNCNYIYLMQVFNELNILV